MSTPKERGIRQDHRRTGTGTVSTVDGDVNTKGTLYWYTNGDVTGLSLFDVVALDSAPAKIILLHSCHVKPPRSQSSAGDPSSSLRIGHLTRYFTGCPIGSRILPVCPVANGARMGLRCELELGIRCYGLSGRSRHMT